MKSVLEQEYNTLKNKFEEGELTWGTIFSGGEGTMSIGGFLKNVSLTHNPTGINIISDQHDNQIENGIAALKALLEKLERD